MKADDFVLKVKALHKHGEITLLKEACDIIEQLQAENKRLKSDLVGVNEVLFKNTNACQQLQAENVKLKNREGFQGSLHCKTKGCDGLIDADYCARCRKDFES